MATMTKAPKRKVSSSKDLKLQPIGDRVVVKREQAEERTSGGIVLPDSAKDKPARGKVVAIGDGKLLEDGTRGKMQLKVGDRVLFTSYAGDVFKVGDEELVLMREDDVLAVIE